ncbi:MAG: alpha/beta fold hydrolase, partial [Candidatus Thorarchaeota archaeon]|nr:alpha/beta fold hydrolase [Candidatus Thorarchaeota archaeon]
MPIGASAMKPNFIDLNGTRIAYEESGTGEPLILLHSGVADMRLWNPQMEVFSKYFQVIRYDARGYGKSSEPREDFHHYKDLESVMDFLGIKSAHLLG